MKQHNKKSKAVRQKCEKRIRSHHVPSAFMDYEPGAFKGAMTSAAMTASTLTLLLALTASSSHALPQNGTVAAGSATVTQTSATNLDIKQTSGNAVINWDKYSIAANETVKYVQPGSNSIVLNRVTGVDPSYIYGHLSGNGQVWVINPNGLLVGPGATIQTGSFLASTMNISNENFMSGTYLFNNTPGSVANIVNQGTIEAAERGYVVLAAPSVTNSGSIVATRGSVHLASGDAVTLSIDNGSLINVAVSGDVAETALGVTNTGHISADGGQVVLTARVAGDIMKNVVNNEGIIEAKSIVEKDGLIILDGGDHGITANSGTLDASGKNAGETGGNVTVVGDKVGLFAGSSVDASGVAGGGTVLIGGNFHGAGAEKNASMTYVDKDATITADSLVNGDGGKVVVWADNAARFYGVISAKGGALGGDGGTVEVSGKRLLVYAGLADLAAPMGKTGTLLLDPDDITIASGSTDTHITVTGSGPFADASSGSGSILSDVTLNNQLNTAFVTITTATGSITSQSGVDVMLRSNSLTLQSAAGINLAGTYRGSGTLNLNFATTLDLTTAPMFVSSPTVNAAGAGSASTITAAGETWNLTGSNAGTLGNLGVTFSSVGNLTDTGAGIFKFGAAGNVAGNITAVGGTLDYTGHATAVDVNLAGSAGTSTGIGGTWSGITGVIGSSSTNDTITGASQTYTLDNSTANKGSNSGVTWTAIENLTDTGTGIFNMGAGGSVTGNLDGGTGGTLNYSSCTNPVTLNLGGTGTTGIGGAWSHIASVTGNAANPNTVTGLNKTYILDNSTANKGSNGGVTWTNFKNITDTGTGIFNMGTGGSVTGNLDGGSGGTLNYSSCTNPVTLNLAGIGTTGIGGSWSHIATVAGNAAYSDTVTGSNKTYILDNSTANKGICGGVTWTNFKNITDTGTGTFNMGTGGSVSGDLDGGIGGTLNYSSYISPVTLNLAGTNTTGITTGTWRGISAVTGSSSNDTISGTNATYNLTAAKAGTSGGVSWTSFEKIADSGTGAIATTGGQTYTLTGDNAGNVATLLPGGYTGIGTLTDSGAGSFKFASGGAVTGSIAATGGVLDYSAGIAGPVTVDVTAKSGTGIGGTWSGITTVKGSGSSDTISGTNATYNLTAANAGTSGGVSWTSFENLHDTAAGIFRFAPAGAVTGGVTAAGGTLDYSALTGPVTVDLTAKTGPGIGTTWNGIATVVGSASTSDIITGSNQTFNLTGADVGNNGSVGWTSFENLNGVSGGNSYIGSGGSLSGAIVDTGTAVTLKGTIQTRGSQTYNGAVTLGGTTDVASTGSGAITFARTVDSDTTARDLTVATSGVTTFGGAIGTTALNSLTITGGTTRIDGDSVTTSGAVGQVYNSAVVLGADTTLNAGSGAITEGSGGSLTTAGLLTTKSGSGQTLVGNGTNAVANFSATNTTSGDITLTNSATPLTIAGISQTGGQLIITNSGAVTSSAPLTVTGATTITAVGQPITLTNANNDFTGSVTVTGAATRITGKNNLAVVMDTTGPAILNAGANLTLSGTSTDTVSATAVDNVTLADPRAAVLHITGNSIAGVMSNSSPLDLTTTASQTGISVNLTGSLPFLTLLGDVRANVKGLGLYNGVVVMGSEMDHYQALINLRTATIASAVNVERVEKVSALARFAGFFTPAAKESLIDSERAFSVPEMAPTLIDR